MMVTEGRERVPQALCVCLCACVLSVAGDASLTCAALFSRSDVLNIK